MVSRGFTNWPPDDQVALLRRPHSVLSADLKDRLLVLQVSVMTMSVTTTTWVSQESSSGWMLSPTLGRVLEDIRPQFDQWWQRRSEDECAALIEHRNDELSAAYREIVQAGTSDKSLPAPALQKYNSAATRP